MFVGQYQFTLDTKKRLVVPAKFRPFFPTEEKEPGVYVTLSTINYEEVMTYCLALYTAPAWKEYTERLFKASLEEIEAQLYLRTVTADTEFCHIDAQWRMVMPLRLINAAGLKRDIMIAGMMNHIEVWNLERWRAYNNWLKEHTADFEKSIYKPGKIPS